MNQQVGILSLITNMQSQQYGEKIRDVVSLILMIVQVLNFARIHLLDVIGMEQQLEDVGSAHSQEHVEYLNISQTQFVLMKITN